MKVFKFGGASIKDADRIRNVTEILKKSGTNNILIVISALGKTTNELEMIVNAHYNQTGKTDELLEALKQKNEIILNELFADRSHPVFNEVNDRYAEIHWIIEDKPEEKFDYIYDQIVSIGEFISTIIVSHYLRSQGIKNFWFDVRDVMKTDNSYREGVVDWVQTQKLMREKLPALLEQGLVITQGFVGCTTENFTTTLGREGSDYTAALFSNMLDAEEMTVWKDVPGILTADPSEFPDAKKIDELSYYEAVEMTYYGAKVIHPKTIKPLQNKNIPLRVRSFLQPDAVGTIIKEKTSAHLPPIIVRIPDSALLSLSTRDYSFIEEGNMSLIYEVFSKHKVKIEMMQKAAISLSVCVENNPTKNQSVVHALRKDFSIRLNKNVQMLTIRHYNQDIINQLTRGKKILVEQKTRNTIQFVLK